MARKKHNKPFSVPSQFIPDTRKKIEVKPLNRTQKQYYKAILENDITFGIGPAGTGKTYLSALTAMKFFSEGLVDKIVIARPMVNAGGEQLGALPGGINEKLDPYVKPILDAFRSYWSARTIQDMLDRDEIEIVPFAFMRGRSFKNTYIIIDEAQNITEDGLLMILTRFGEGCKMVITGDPRQTDLPHNNCLIIANRKLRSVSTIKFINFHPSEVVRHPTVKEILTVWESSKKGDDYEYEKTIIDDREEDEELPAFLYPEMIPTPEAPQYTNGVHKH